MFRSVGPRCEAPAAARKAGATALPALTEFSSDIDIMLEAALL